MNTSTNSNEVEIRKAGGAFADGLTLIRFLLTPVVMFLIIFKGWPNMNTAILVSILFAIAALTDFFDDITGGAETSIYRKYGWFDDIADTVLMAGTLAAMLWVFFTVKAPDIVPLDDSIKILKPALPWLFVIPAGIIIAREVIVGLIKGFELSRTRVFNDKLGDLKTAMIMLGTCILLASPWLSPWLTSSLAKGGDVSKVSEWASETELQNNADPSIFDAYIQTPDYIWNTGLIILWIGAILSLITGFALLSGKRSPANDG